MKINIRVKEPIPKLPDVPIRGHIYQRVGGMYDGDLFFAAGLEIYLHNLEDGKIWATGDSAWGGTLTDNYWIDVTDKYEVREIC